MPEFKLVTTKPVPGPDTTAQWLRRFVAGLACARYWQVWIDRGGAYAIAKHNGHTVFDPRGTPQRTWDPVEYWLVQKGSVWGGSGNSRKLHQGRLTAQKREDFEHVLAYWAAAAVTPEEPGLEEGPNATN